jgi:hypothetical protein
MTVGTCLPLSELLNGTGMQLGGNYKDVVQWVGTCLCLPIFLKAWECKEGVGTFLVKCIRMQDRG